MTFQDIEARRSAAAIDQKVLCERAGVDPSTYSQIKNKRRRRGGYIDTLEKLSSALDALVEERGKA